MIALLRDPLKYFKRLRLPLLVSPSLRRIVRPFSFFFNSVLSLEESDCRRTIRRFDIVKHPCTAGTIPRSFEFRPRYRAPWSKR